MLKDMNGQRIEIGSYVKRYPLINKKTNNFKLKKIKHIAPTHTGGEILVWFEGGGGAHHPKAVEVISKEEFNQITDQLNALEKIIEEIKLKTPQFPKEDKEKLTQYVLKSFNIL